MESEQSRNFNERLNQWVASQGFWFQVRYSMTGGGIRGLAMFHLLRIFFRLAVFLLLAALACWIFLMKRPNTAGFSETFRTGLQEGLAAEDLAMRGLQHDRGRMEITRLAADGGEGAFYDTFEARNIRFSMGLVDGLLREWHTGIVSIARMEIDLRAGTDSPESAAKLAEMLFRKHEVVMDSLEVGDATLRWGYSERTQGSIESSFMRAQRSGDGWRLDFDGGTFNQNWLKDLEIVSLVAQVGRDGVVFESAEFRIGNGVVEFPGLRVIGGELPQVEGIVKLRNLDLGNILPPALRGFLEGTISGDFNVTGSTNSSEGIAFEGQVLLDGKDVVTMRDRFHLLKALSVVDYSRNYHRIDFREGAFQIRTQGGGMQLSGVDLKADDLLTMNGAVSVRLPTQREIDEALAQGVGPGGMSMFGSEDELAGAMRLLEGDSEFNLRRAAQEARREKENKRDGETDTVFDRIGLSYEMRRLRNEAAERISRMLRYDGGLRITLPGDAFERAPLLQRLYPPEALTGRIPMKVVIDGHLYELTLRQAEDIYQQGRR